MPKVSIVLPVYNGEKFLRESLDSILSQTLEDWELIVVNDCSTDHSMEIVKEYISRDSRIRLINNEVNKKLPTSLNIGFKNAKGKYLTWTSDDNIYLPTALDELACFLDFSDHMLVCAGVKSINDKGEELGEWEEYDEDRMYYINDVGACFMYRAEMIHEIGEYDSTMFLVEDFDYWMRILIRYGEIGYLNKKLYLYRFHEDSLTETKRADVHRQLLKLRRRYIKEIIEHFTNKPEYLTLIFLDFMFDEDDYSYLYEMFYECQPILKMLKKLADERFLIAYGAGGIGDKAYRELGDRIEMYVDQCADKIGFIKNGKKVLFPTELTTYLSGKSVLITMKPENTLSAMQTLMENGVCECFVKRWCS